MPTTTALAPAAATAAATPSTLAAAPAAATFASPTRFPSTAAVAAGFLAPLEGFQVLVALAALVAAAADPPLQSEEGFDLHAPKRAHTLGVKPDYQMILVTVDAHVFEGEY